MFPAFRFLCSQHMFCFILDPCPDDPEDEPAGTIEIVVNLLHKLRQET